MFSLKTLAIAGVFMAAAIAPVAVGTNVLAANSNACTAEAAHPSIGTRIQPNHKFTRKGNRVYIKVVVKGGKNCTKTVTLEAWKAPNGTDAKPYREQTLYRSKTLTGLKPGEYRMSVQLPNCYYQVDLIHGGKTMGASPDADIKFDSDRMIGSVHGGNQTCVNTPDTPDEPEAPETPTTPTTPKASSTATSLTKTGPSAIVAGIFTGVSSLGTAAHYFVRRKLMNV